MRLFDTHCHFESSETAPVAAALRRARAAGVEMLMAVGGSPSLNDSALRAAAVAAASPGEMPVCLVACGYDRDQAAEPPPIPETLSLAAWGEIGLDYHCHPETRDAQLRLFAGQLEEARRRDLPVVIHTREADGDTLALLGEIPSRGVVHCFTGAPAFCRKLLDLGFYISLSGIVTFRAAQNVRESARVVPDDRLLVETDSPFLAPVPMRGRANEPAFVAYTAAFLAELRKTDAETLAEQTFCNAERLLCRPRPAFMV